MTDLISRRGLLGAMAAAGALQIASVARSADKGAARVSADDPTAVALGYVETAASLEPSKNPTYKAGSVCGTCLQIQGQAGQAFRPCNLFAGKLVSAQGWCRAWSARSAHVGG